MPPKRQKRHDILSQHYGSEKRKWGFPNIGPTSKEYFSVIDNRIGGSSSILGTRPRGTTKQTPQAQATQNIFSVREKGKIKRSTPELSSVTAGVKEIRSNRNIPSKVKTSMRSVVVNPKVKQRKTVGRFFG